MTLHLNDREEQVVLTALEALRQNTQIFITTTPNAPFKPINEFDLLSPQHTLMHTITLLAKMTKRTPQSFANPHPSQNPAPGTNAG